MFRAALYALPLLIAPAASAMTLSSSDIADGQAISVAQIYPRCGGENVSPALAWNGAPRQTRSYALTMIDLDVKPAQWSHWIVIGIPPKVTSLARGAKTLPAGSQAIVSNFGDAGYDGPCPPAGTGTHHYKITIWALPTATISLPANEKATDLAADLEKRALDRASITGFVLR